MYQQHFSVFCDMAPSPEIIKYQIWKESCILRRKDFEERRMVFWKHCLRIYLDRMRQSMKNLSHKNQQHAYNQIQLKILQQYSQTLFN